MHMLKAENQSTSLTKLSINHSTSIVLGRNRPNLEPRRVGKHGIGVVLPTTWTAAACRSLPHGISRWLYHCFPHQRFWNGALRVRLDRGVDLRRG